MRFAVLMMLVVALLFGAVGCIGLSKDDQAALNRMTIEERDMLAELYAERKAALEHVKAETDKITAKIMDKTITYAEGEEYLKLMKMQSTATFEKISQGITDVKEKFREQKESLEDAGYGKGDMIAGLIISIFGSVLSSLTGVRLWRGSVNNRSGDIGVRAT